MKSWKKYLSLLLALVLALTVTACGDSGTVDDGDDVPDDGGSNSSFSGGQILADEDFEADVSTWQGDDGGQLLLDLPNGCYTYRTWFGRVGTGSLYHDRDDDLVLEFGDLSGENDYYLIQEGTGFRPFHLNGEEGGEWGELNGLYFQPAQGEMTVPDTAVLDGVWQNALGYSLAFDT